MYSKAIRDIVKNNKKHIRYNVTIIISLNKGNLYPILF